MKVRPTGVRGCVDLYSGPTLVTGRCDGDDGALDNRVSFPTLPTGDYEVRARTTAPLPAGWFTQQPFSLTVSAGGTAAEVSFRQPRKVTIITKGPNDTKVGAGVCYESRLSGFDTVGPVCDDGPAGPTLVLTVPAGVSTVVQTTAPTGFAAPEPEPVDTTSANRTITFVNANVSQGVEVFVDTDPETFDPNVTVRIYQGSTLVDKTSTTAGSPVAFALAPGTYRVRVTAAGGIPNTQDVEVSGSLMTRVDITVRQRP